MVATIHNKMLPPAHLLVLSLPSSFKTVPCFPLPNDEALCRTREALAALASYNPGAKWKTMSKGKENAPAQLHGTQELSVSGDLAHLQHQARDSPCAQSSPCAGSSIKNHRCEAAGALTNTHAEACPLAPYMGINELLGCEMVYLKSDIWRCNQCSEHLQEH